jgi:predicted RNA-binding Zn-ribbon protein involved in translation (DUF1610 family)
MRLNYYIGDQMMSVEVHTACPGCGQMGKLVMHVRVTSYCNNKRKFYVGCNCGWEGPEADRAELALVKWEARAMIYG